MRKSLLMVLAMLLVPGVALAGPSPRVLSSADLKAQIGLPPRHPDTAPPIFPSPAQLEHSRDKVRAPMNTVSTRRLPYNGGPIMQTSKVFLIFWEPPTLQDGSGSGVRSGFNNQMYDYVVDVNGSQIGNVQTQYWMRGSDGYRYGVQNKVSYGGYYLDQTAYPKNVCYNPVTGSNCVTDAWVRYEIKKAMDAKGWTGGYNKLFILYTGYGEGSCSVTPNSNGACKAGSAAYKNYCGYHFYDVYATQPIIYANMPYADSGHTTNCYSTMPASPHGSKVLDSEFSITSHEHFEAITDPIPTTNWYGWIDLWEANNNLGGENGDKCAWYFSPLRYGSNGNQIMNSEYYILQDEFSDNAYDAGQTPCVQK
jgi:hypothetical protein